MRAGRAFAGPRKARGRQAGQLRLAPAGGLTDGDLVLRPSREDDLPQALEWDNDPEAFYYMQSETQPVFTLDHLGDMYRGAAQAAHVFVIELTGRDIGTCWLQDMNVERLNRRFPGRELKRIDLSIGDKDLWGPGQGRDRRPEPRDRTRRVHLRHPSHGGAVPDPELDALRPGSSPNDRHHCDRSLDGNG